MYFIEFDRISIQNVYAYGNYELDEIPNFVICGTIHRGILGIPPNELDQCYHMFLKLQTVNNFLLCLTLHHSQTLIHSLNYSTFRHKCLQFERLFGNDLVPQMYL